MPAKFRIHPKLSPPRRPPISRYAYLEAGRCLNCRRCVKYTSCIYNVYETRDFDPVSIQDTGDVACVSCFRCIQECKAGILSRAINPRWERLGNEHWTPPVISSIWRQAENGKIPVSGAGYRGPFTGPGFDSMWTDMSEIVRPTRDGIHGREFISTVIELGRRPEKLSFDPDGGMTTEPPRFVEVPLPVILDVPPFGKTGISTRRAMAKAAQKLGTLVVASLKEASGPLSEFKENLMVKVEPDQEDFSGVAGVPVIELLYSDRVYRQMDAAKQESPQAVVAVQVWLDQDAPGRVLELAREGAEAVHLKAHHMAHGFGADAEVFITELVSGVHEELVGHAIREQLTLLASGGIAMAEHVAKTIISGADGVGVDLAALIALECRVCRDCEEQEACPVDIENVDEEWGAQRILNLMGSWHSQLIEVMGAMGMREVRRLRGERGRTMYFKDLEKESFAPLFGERKPAPLSSGNPGWDAAQREQAPPPEVKAPAPPLPERHAYPPVENLVEGCGSRFRNKLSKYRVVITDACTDCYQCVDACRFGALQKTSESGVMVKPEPCRGPGVCRSQGSFCVDACPEDAIMVGLNPLWNTFGDPRWTPDLIVSTWDQAETGTVPYDSGLEFTKGESGGGFDRIELNFPEKPPPEDLRPENIDLSIPLNRREESKRPGVRIGMPMYGGGMSFGSISLATMLSRARAYKAFDSFVCTGEGGYPGELEKYDHHIITQVATGLFGVREDTIKRVRVVEFKYAQGAKPGLGGHLLGDKVTPAVAKMREAVEGSALFSPFPFHSVYSVEDHKKHVDWIKHINEKALVAVKVSTPTDVDMVAVGSYYAGAHIIHIDGSYGGTGAAPDIAKKNIAMPIEYAIPKVHNFLAEEGIRDQMTLIASGGIRTAWDVAKAIALGADGVVLGTSEMVALECIRCGNCESGRGCPRGIATTDPELCALYDQAWGEQRLINMFHSFCAQLQDILWRLSMRSVTELVGRTDALYHLDYEGK